MKLLSKLEQSIASLTPSVITEQRKQLLQPLIESIQRKVDASEPVRLFFICTHNSRRSQLAQAWSQAIAGYFGIPKVVCYSGGTLATDFYIRAREVLDTEGFIVKGISKGRNPVHMIKYAEDEHPVLGFSKVIDHPFNPRSGSIAVVTCSEADAQCPIVAGAELRISIPFQDPKKYDGTQQELEQYQKSSQQIAAELFFVFNSLKRTQ